MKRWKRVVAAAMVLTLGVGVAACSPDPDEGTSSGFVGGTSTAPMRVLTWNLCGDVCWPKADPDSFFPQRDFRGDNSRRADAVDHAVAAWDATVFAAQEVCESQYEAIVAKLKIRGWKGFYFKAEFDGVGHCDDYVGENPKKRKYGNAIFTKVLPTSYTYLNIQGDDYPSTPGYNWFLVCAHSTAFSACTTHIRVKCAADYVGDCTALKNAQQVEQFGIIRASLRKMWLVRPVVFAGDMNSFPAGNVNPIYTDFIEADAAQNEATVVKENTSKIDFIFYDKLHWKNQDGDSASAGPGTISDHRLLRGLAYRK